MSYDHKRHTLFIFVHHCRRLADAARERYEWAVKNGYEGNVVERANEAWVAAINLRNSAEVAYGIDPGDFPDRENEPCGTTSGGLSVG